MRAREFIVEQRAKLDPDIAAPMHDTYIIPGIRNNDAYHTMRLGTAIARARADVAGVTKDFPEFTAQQAFGQNAVVIGFNDTVDDVIDRALAMTDTPGGKILISTPHSEEPDEVQQKSPIRAFGGY